MYQKQFLSGIAVCMESFGCKVSNFWNKNSHPWPARFSTEQRDIFIEIKKDKWPALSLRRRILSGSTRNEWTRSRLQIKNLVARDESEQLYNYGEHM